MMKMWPFQENRLNINPQNFLKESIRKAIPVSSAKLLSKQKNEQRKTRFLVSIVLDSPTQDEQERFEYHLNKRIEEMNLEEIERYGDGFLAAFKTATECVTLAWSILRTKTTLFSKIKVALHAGPIILHDDPVRIVGLSVEHIKAMLEFAIPGKVFATFQFASALALESDKYAIEFAGLLTVTGGAKLELFQVNKHEEAFDL